MASDTINYVKFLAETTKTRMEVGTGDVNGGNGIRVDVG